MIAFFAAVTLLVLCITPLLAKKSTGAVAKDLHNDIRKDVEDYYNSIKGTTHAFRMSGGQSLLSEKANLINSYSKFHGELQKINGSVTDIYNRIVDNSVEKEEKIITDASGKANILTGYIQAKKDLDAVLRKTSKTNSNLTVKEQSGDSYYKYTMAALDLDTTTSLSNKARSVKGRVEQLILVYQVTKEAKYLAALKKEIVEAAKWSNNWQSSQYIDTVEIAYAVSLGYDYAYNALTVSQRYLIENRLLTAVLMYGTDHYSNALNRTYGNFNQVGHSGAGTVALALISSSGDGECERIKVISDDGKGKGIQIEYPVKSQKDKALVCGRADKLIGNSVARIDDDALYDLLKDKIQGSGNNRYIRLRTLYVAVIAKTTDYLPSVIKSNNMYADGSYPEGKNYYLFGMKYFGYYLAALQNTLGKSYNLLSFEGDGLRDHMLNSIVFNPVYISSVSGNNFDYADSARTTASRVEGRAFGSYASAGLEDDLFYLTNLNAKKGHEKVANVIYDYKKRTARAWGFNGIMWYDKSYDKKSAEIAFEDAYNNSIYHNDGINKNLSRLGVSAFKSSYTGGDGIFVAMKGGDTSANHTHLDLGSYVLDAMGTRWVADAGTGYGLTKYNDKNRRRWQYYMTRAEAHSTIVVNAPKTVGGYVAADQWIQARAPFENGKFKSSKNSGFAIVNLTDAYNKSNNDIQLGKADMSSVCTHMDCNDNTVKRGLKLFNHKKYVLVQDKVNLKSVGTYNSFINIATKETGGKDISANILSNNEAILTDGLGHQVKVILKTKGLDAKFVYVDNVTGRTGVLNSDLDKASSGSVNHKRLVVRYKSVSGSESIDAEIGVFYIPVDGSAIDNDVLKLVSLDKWHMPEKPIIKVVNNGKTIVSNSSIKGNALIKISKQSGSASSDVIKYSLDNGVTWYKYDDNDSKDVQRRTIAGNGSQKRTVLAVLDDGAGIQSDTAKITNFVVNISDSGASNGGSRGQTSEGGSDLAKNSLLKTLEVVGYELETSDYVNYSLTVSNATNEIMIKAKAKDDRTFVEGTGVFKLDIGSNKYEITARSADGLVESYYLTVVRRDDVYSISDMNAALHDEAKEISLTVNDGDVITKEEIEKIKESGKTINLVKYDDDNKMVYSLSIEGDKIENLEEINAGSLFTVNDNGRLDGEVGDNQKLYINFNVNGLPSGSKFKVNVSDTYSNGDSVNLYAYDNSSVKMVSQSLTIKDDLLEFDLENYSDYLATTAVVKEVNYKYLYVLVGVLGVVAIAGATFFMIRKNKDSKKNKQNANANIAISVKDFTDKK